MVTYFLSKYIWGSGEHQRQRTALAALCEESGLSLVEAKGLKADHAIGVVNGWQISVGYHEVLFSLGNAQNLTTFAVHYAPQTEFNFLVKYGRSWLDSKKKRFVYKAAGTAMENNYFMKTNDESKFAEFLKHDSWRKLFESKTPVRMSCGANSGPSPNEFSYHVTGLVYDPESLKSIIENLVETLEHMRSIGFAELTDRGLN